MTRGERILFWSRIARKAEERVGKAWERYRGQQAEPGGFDAWLAYLRAIETARWAKQHLDDLILPPGAALTFLARNRGKNG